MSNECVCNFFMLFFFDKKCHFSEIKKFENKTFNFRPHSVGKMAAPMEHGSTFVYMSFLLLFCFVSGYLLMEISEQQAEPYMDEIFHIPQAQKYCQGKFNEVSRSACCIASLISVHRLSELSIARVSCQYSLLPLGLSLLFSITLPIVAKLSNAK